MKYGYEDLSVWDKAVNFAVEVITVVENIATDRKHLKNNKIDYKSQNLVPFFAYHYFEH